MEISLNLLACPFELSGCKLKSPNIHKLSWSGTSSPVNLEIHQKLTCTVLKPIQADNETTERIVSNTCRDRLERFK